MEDIGLVVEFDGKFNAVFSHGDVKKYPVGGMASEYARFVPTSLKEVLLKCPNSSELVTRESATEATIWLETALREHYELITSTMILTEFYTTIAELLDLNEEGRKQHLSEINSDIVNDSIKQFVLENTSYQEFGMDTIEQLLLTVYSMYAISFVVFKHSFSMLASEKEYEEKQVKGFISIFEDNTNFQHFGFRIMLYDKEFHSIFTIKTGISLIAFEAAHAMDNSTVFVKCQNCNHYFVPAGRSDTKYCNYPAPQRMDKTCKEIGAQIARSNKEKNENTVKEYRKIYMRLKMLTRRNPDNPEYNEKLKRFVEETKEWKRSMAEGKASSDDYLSWLNSL